MVVDSDQKITWLNKATVELLGYKEEELIGKPFSAILSSDELDLKETLKDYDMFYLTKSEEKIAVSFNSSTLYDSNGKSIGTIVTAKDVREKKQLVRELRKAKEELEGRVLDRTRELAQVKDFQENIIMSMTDSLIVFSPEGKIREANYAAQRLLGYLKGELNGKDVDDIAGRDSGLLSQDGGEDSSCEIKYISKTGEEIPVSVRGSLLHDRDGKLVGVLTIARDMRERLLAEAKMREASRMTALGQFAAGAAHEINNPLSIISGNAQYLTEKLLSIEADKGISGVRELREGLDLIHRYALSCGSIIQRLLTFSRGVSDTPENKIINVNLAISDTLAVLEPQFKLSGIGIERHLSQDELPVFGNASQLQHVFMNILLNAREAVGENGHVLVTTKKVMADIHIEIKDDGSGLSRENLPKVFDPFFTTRKPGAGTGLGLSVVYSIVREHKGVVDISSEENKGTTVTVRLPARSY